MDLLKVERYECFEASTGEISWYAAWLGSVVDLSRGRPVLDTDCQRAIIASNINVLRREAPYAYLFANGYTLITWREEDLGSDPRYLGSLPSRQLRRGVWLAYPAHPSPTTTVVTELATGDVLPFVHLLQYEEFALLCLRDPIPLRELDERVLRSPNNTEAVMALLADGGCVVTAIDYERFAVQTLDARYARYFRAQTDS